MLLTIIAFIVILSILVLIHELGHFILAKKYGIKVEEFGFGFPPRLFSIKKGETLYSVNLLPVGGFVKLYGEDEAGGGSVKVAPSKIHIKKDINRAFYARPAWQRLSVIVAGVVMNFVLAVAIISYLFAAQGVALPTKNVKIVEVLKNSPAEKAGLKKGDFVISVNGKAITNNNEFIDETRRNLGKEIGLQVRSGDSIREVRVLPRKDFPKGEGPMGVAISNVEVKKYPWYQAPFFGTLEALKFSYLIAQGLFDMLFNLIAHGTKPSGVAGPIGVAQLTGQAVSYGFNATLWFAALLSLNLAVLNVLPIPALDGGRLFFILIEVVTRRKINPKYESYAHVAGLIVLLGLMAAITVFDVARLLSGKSIVQP